MSPLFEEMKQLTSAEEFLDFFAVPYDPAVVNIHRLHVLTRFHQYLRATDGLAALDLGAQRETCRELLARAYDDFIHSTPQQEKIFRVFQGRGVQTVSVAALRAGRA